MHRYFIFSLALIFSVHCLAQEASAPYKEVTQALSDAFKAQNPREGLQILNRVSVSIEQAGDSLQLEYLIASGIAHGQLGNADSSFYFLDQAEALSQKRSEDLLLIKVYNTKGLVLMGLSKYEEALSSFQKGLAIGEGRTEPKYLEAIRKILGNSGGIFYELGDFEGALRQSQRALEISNQLSDSSGLAYNHLRLAITYQAMDNIKSCLSHLNLSNAILTNLNDTTTLLYVQNTLGEVYTKARNYKSALQSYGNANRLAIAIANKEEELHTSLSMGNAYFNMGDNGSAEKIGLEVLTAATKNGMTEHRKNAYDILYRVAFKKNNLRDALSFRNMYYALKDSIANEDVKSRIAELETKYETEKKKEEIIKLTLENELSTANLEKSRNAIIAMAVGSTLFILLLVVYFTMRHKKQKAEKEAQELQMEALKNRFIELHASPAQLAVELGFDEFNEKLTTHLTEREFETLKLSLEGKTNAEIADKLFISISTVKFHLRNTYAKMGVDNRKEAFQFMLKTS
jgi:DNA-binding CsgD family transcriptional regulator